MDSFISSASGQVAAEQSEDDYLAELLGMNSDSPPSPVSEVCPHSWSGQVYTQATFRTE